MRKILAIIKRELMERVRTRAFLISTILGPLLMVGFFFASAATMSGGERQRRLAIVDGTGDGFGTRIESVLAEEQFLRKGEANPRYRITRFETDAVEAVRDSLIAFTGFSREDRPDGFDGVLVITDALAGEGRAQYYGGNAAALEAMQRLESSMSQAVRTVRLEREGVDPAVVTRALMPVRMATTKVENGTTTGESGAASSMLAMVLGFVLYFAIILYGNQTAMSVIEEKTSRIMEVLASSVRPFEMLLGKVLGVGTTGLVQLGIWAGAAVLILGQRSRIASALGMDPSAAAAIPLPSFPPDLLVIFLLYFITGFLLYGALFAALGSMVNSMQESQQFMLPITLMIVFGFMGMMGAVRDPHSGMAVTMSYIPFFSPFVMPVRWSMGAVPLPQLLASLVLMVAAMLAVTWLAGRIYRTGILMYGKKPSLGEVWRWIRA